MAGTAVETGRLAHMTTVRCSNSSVESVSVSQPEGVCTVCAKSPAGVQCPEMLFWLFTSSSMLWGAVAVREEEI